MNDSASVESTPLWGNGRGKDAWLESELCHRQILRALPVGVYTCAAEGRVTFFNRAVALIDCTNRPASS